eukprot:snap_masked-scaffold_23-processed-gene-4.13-mRNA-1 protein AED:1.00 eAED:1.00 QI:0/0/0/0/1/1/6/0/183
MYIPGFSHNDRFGRQNSEAKSTKSDYSSENSHLQGRYIPHKAAILQQYKTRPVEEEFELNWKDGELDEHEQGFSGEYQQLIDQLNVPGPLLKFVCRGADFSTVGKLVGDFYKKNLNIEHLVLEDCNFGKNEFKFTSDELINLKLTNLALRNVTLDDEKIHTYLGKLLEKKDKFRELAYLCILV